MKNVLFIMKLCDVINLGKTMGIKRFELVLSSK